VSQAPITVAGIPIPSDAPLFLAVLAIHVAAGLTCVITGAIAMLIPKGAGRHPRFGTFYYRGLTVVFVTMGVLSAMRWAQDYHLFILGVLSFTAAFVGRQAAPSRTTARIRVHVIGMGLSYILLLTAFYVDNGKNLPLWKLLPPLAYWLVPLAVGVPIMARVLRHHPLVSGERRLRGGAA
jgi:hypothetical protein